MRHTTTDLERRIADTGGGAMALPKMVVASYVGWCVYSIVDSIALAK